MIQTKEILLIVFFYFNRIKREKKFCGKMDAKYFMKI